MVTDKTAELEVSNYRVQTGTSATEKYIANHVVKDTALAENPMFAEFVTVNETGIKSSTNVWDLSQVQNNVVKGSYALGSQGQPLYFAETGTSALLQMKIEYTSEHAAGVDYQPDLFGGIMLSDGTNRGWLTASQTGIAYTGFKFESGLVREAVLTYPDKKSVNLTIAVQKNYVYVYFDNVLVARKKVSQIVSGYKNGTDLALGLYMYADKAADIRFSNISMTTDSDQVSAYMKANK